MKNLQPDTLIKNPQGCHVVSSVDVPAPATKVWAVVGNFAGFDQFIPALSHIEMTGEGVSSLRKNSSRTATWWSSNSTRGMSRPGA